MLEPTRRGKRNWRDGYARLTPAAGEVDMVTCPHSHAAGMCRACAYVGCMAMRVCEEGLDVRAYLNLGEFWLSQNCSSGYKGRRGMTGSHVLSVPVERGG